MKTILNISLYILSTSWLHAHQIVSIRDGDFFADSVWMGNVQPDLTRDSIDIRTNLIYGSKDIKIAGTCYMHINSCNRICGNGGVVVAGAACLWNEGCIYADSIIAESRVWNSGYIDIAGFYMRVDNGGSYNYNPPNPAQGWTYGHRGTQDCMDSSGRYAAQWSVSQSGNSIEIEFPLRDLPKQIDFGDGYTTSSSELHVSHEYNGYGLFKISVKYLFICDSVILARQVRVDSVPPIYSCTTPTSFSVYPDPCNAYVYIRYESCLPGSYTLPIYDGIGQHVRDIIVDNSGTAVRIETNELASGMYFIRKPDYRYRSGMYKIIVIH